MAKNINEIMQKLPPERIQNIEARVNELIAEHMTLWDIRKARKRRITSKVDKRNS